MNILFSDLLYKMVMLSIVYTFFLLLLIYKDSMVYFNTKKKSYIKYISANIYQYIFLSITIGSYYWHYNTTYGQIKEIIYMILFFSYVLCDGILDSQVKRDSNVSWKKYHLIKWIAFNGTCILMLFFIVTHAVSSMSYIYVSIMLILSLVAWGVGYELIGGEKYSSFWLQRIEQFLGEHDGKKDA